MNILLIGPRGCGKSTVGKVLAERTSRAFVDLDNEVLKQFTQSSVSDVWNELGESAWRKMECEIFLKIMKSDNQIIALGGGAPMIADVQGCIQSAQRLSAARVVYLRCSIEVLKGRLQHSPGDRPSLTGVDPVEEIANVVSMREATYKSLADVDIDASRNVDEIVGELMNQQQLSG